MKYYCFCWYLFVPSGYYLHRQYLIFVITAQKAMGKYLIPKQSIRQLRHTTLLEAEQSVSIPAFYFKGTRNINIHNFSLSWPEQMPEYYTNAIFGEDFSGFKLSGSSLSILPLIHVSLIHVKNGSEVEIDENLKSVRKENIR